METQVGAQLRDGCGGELRLHDPQEDGLRHVDLGDASDALDAGALRFEVTRPVDRRRERRQLGERHRVIGVVRVAPLDACQRRLGQLRLEPQDGGRVRTGLLRRLAAEHQDPRHESGVLPAQLDAFRIGLEVVVAIGKAETRGLDRDDDERGVDRVLVGARLEEERARALVVQPRNRGDELGAGRQRGDPVEHRTQGPDTGGVDRRGVHAGREIVADFLLHCRAVGRLRVFFEDAPEKLLVVGRELGVDAPRGLVFGDRVARHPAAASEAVEIGAGVDAAVEARQVERR